MSKKQRISRSAGTLSAFSAPALAALLLVGAPSAFSALQEGEDLDSTRAALEKWVEVRRIIGQERSDWSVGRQVLADQVELLKREVESVRAKAAEAQASIAEAELKRASLTEQSERLASASAALAVRIVELEAGTRALLVRAPDPIRERVRPLSQRMPDASGDSRLSLSERFQNVVGILNEVNKFNGEVTVTSELRELPDGSSAEVTALYIGIGQGYYTSTDGKSAGLGTATSDGWTWQAANESAAEIARAVAILRNEQVADYVRLPTLIQ